MIEFHEDEPYLKFLSSPSNRTGYVINTYRVPNKKYVVLHKATCGTIQGSPVNGKSFMGDFCKIWAATAEELIEWAETHFERSPQTCGRCKPLGKRTQPAQSKKTDVIEDEDDPNDPYYYVPLRESPKKEHSSDGGETILLDVRLISNEEDLYFVAFSSLENGERYLEEPNFPRIKQPLSSCISTFITIMQADSHIAGVVFDPGGPTQWVKMRNEISELLIAPETIKTEDILSVIPLSEAASPAMLTTIKKALLSEGIKEARGVCITFIDMHQIWVIAIPSDNPVIISKVWNSTIQALTKLLKGKAEVPDVTISDLNGNRMAADFGSQLM